MAASLSLSLARCRPVFGCRFNEHCPSTMEILCCIHSGTEVAGVISFTAFTKEGQKRISENTEVYLNAITKLSSLIGEYLQQFSEGSAAADTEKLIESLMSLCEQPLTPDRPQRSRAPLQQPG